MYTFFYLILIGALLAVVYVIKRLEKGIGSEEKEKAMYAYTVRESIMTAPEQEVYALLQKVAAIF